MDDKEKFLKNILFELTAGFFLALVVVCISAFFLLIIKNAIASETFENFDTYNNNDLASIIPDWENSIGGIVRSGVGYEENACSVSTNSDTCKYNFATGTIPTEIKYYVKNVDNLYQGNVQYFSIGTSSAFILYLNYSYPIKKLQWQFDDAQNGTSTFGDLMDSEINTYYLIDLTINDGFLTVKIDGETKLTLDGFNQQFNFFQIYGAGTNPLARNYLDNFYVTDQPLDFEISTENYDFQLSEKEPDFGTVANQVCFIGVECRLYFSFNNLAIGYPMYLFNYDDINAPGHEIATTTVTRSFSWQNFVIIPNQATSTELKYNLLLDAGDYGWIVKTGIKINWWTEEEWQAFIDENMPVVEEFCAEKNVCANVATSSDFLYGIQCGFQKGLCWTMIPSAGSKTFFLNAVTKFENSFPFNFYFTIVNQAKSDLQKSETMNASFDFPMYSTSTREVSWQPLISSTTVSSVWSGDSYDLANNIITWMWWIAVIAAITFLVYKQML